MIYLNICPSVHPFKITTTLITIKGSKITKQKKKTEYVKVKRQKGCLHLLIQHTHEQ